MSKLREPIPAAQAFVLIFSGVAFGVAQHWAGSMTVVEFALALALLEFAVQPVSYLIHELGHGVVACRLGGAPASIMVGRGPWLQFSLGQMGVNFSLLPSRGVCIRGVCRYQPGEMSWRSRALVSLAGPAATLIETLVGLGVALLLWPHAGTFARNMIALSLIGLVSSLVINLSPIKINRGGKPVIFGNDGAAARIAFRLHREGVPIRSSQLVVPGTWQQTPATRSTQLAVTRATDSQLTAVQPAHASHSPANPERQRDAERARTSIPPPVH